MFILWVENFNYNIFAGMRSINVIMWGVEWCHQDNQKQPDF